MDKTGWDRFDVYLYIDEYMCDRDDEATDAKFTIVWPATLDKTREAGAKVRITAPSGEGGTFDCWAFLTSKMSIEDFFWANF